MQIDTAVRREPAMSKKIFLFVFVTGSLALALFRLSVLLRSVDWGRFTSPLSALLNGCPLILILASGLRWKKVIVVLGILAFQWAATVTITSAQINQILLQHQRRMNQNLDEQIRLQTRELAETNRELENISQMDTITPLYNKRYFLTIFDRILQKTQVGETVVLFFTDLDRFKAINDTYGHDIGDEVLVEIARRVSAWNIYGAILARFGGDEFVCAVRGRYDRADAARMAAELIRRCHDPMQVPPGQFQVTMSVGIALYPLDAQERSTLMKYADIAMYHAKQQDSSRFAFFSSEIRERSARKADLETALALADLDREFELYFQPVFLAADLRLTGAEALLQWRSPVFGPVAAAEFIPVAEETGMIIPLGEWVLRAAVNRIQDWNRRFRQNLRISVNLSPRQLDSSRFVAYLQNLVRDSGIQPEWLDLEIGEQLAMKGSETVTSILQALAGIGVTVSIDNFGTGYSSLSYLQRYAINRLKIARPLLANIVVGSTTCQIVKAIILMSKALGIRTTATGIETEEQLRILAELACDEVQGYLTGQPMPADQLEKDIIRIAGRSAFCLL
jgi:diguanylate cyclase